MNQFATSKTDQEQNQVHWYSFNVHVLVMLFYFFLYNAVLLKVFRL